MQAVLTQIENALPQLIASLILAALTAGAGRVINWLRGGAKPAAAMNPAAYPPSYPTPPAYPVAPNPGTLNPGMPNPNMPNPAMSAPPAVAAPRLNWGQALLHIGILQLAVNVVGVIVGALVRLVTTSQQAFLAAFIPIQLLLGTLAMIALFIYFGLRAPRALLWRHLSVVALGTAILTLLVNSAFALTAEFLNPAAVVFALFQTFLAMGIGGGIVALMRPKAAAMPVAARAYAPTQPPYYPPYPSYPQGAPQQRVPASPPASPTAPPNQAPWPGPAMPPAPPAGGAAAPGYGPGYPPPAPPHQP